jgi:hypothetical protein
MFKHTVSAATAVHMSFRHCHTYTVSTACSQVSFHVNVTVVGVVTAATSATCNTGAVLRALLLVRRHGCCVYVGAGPPVAVMTDRDARSY